MSNGLKRFVEILLGPWVFYYVALYRLGCGVMERNRAFELVSERLAARPGGTGLILRRAYYRRVLTRCGKDCTFSFGVILSKADVTFGDRVALGLGCSVGSARFASDIVVGPGVSFVSGRRQHGFERRDIPMARQPGEFKTISIGDDTWFGAGAIVTDDVGKGAIVAAGAVVVAPVAEFTIVGGNPARAIAERP